MRRVRREKPIALRGHGQKLAFSIQLEAEVASTEFASDTDAKWMHVATEGLYLGYRGGSQPFSLTRAKFDQMVANFRNHPQFAKGADGNGSGDVVQWDFDHASEQSPTAGDRPVFGAPAQGWVLDLKVVDGGDGGKAQLHALTRFLEPARGYVKAGKYKWASIAAEFNAVDPVSGQKIGMMLTSIALTNRPFLQALAPLAASAADFGTGTDDGGQTGDGEDVQLYYAYRAESAEDAVCQLKKLFSLPATAGVAQILTEVGKLRDWISNGTTPLGVDANDLLEGMRQIFGMDIAEQASAVLDRAPAIVQRLIEENAIEANEPVPMSATGEQDDMDLKALAKILGARETEESITAAARALVDMRVALSKALGCKDDEGAVAAAATSAVALANDGGSKLAALLSALKVDKFEAASGRVVELSAAHAELATLKPEHEKLLAAGKKTLAEQAERDVDAVLASRKLGAEMKPALLLHRNSDPDGFAKAFPVQATSGGAGGGATDPRSRTLLAAPGGAQLSAEAAGRIVGQGAGGEGGGTEGAINLSSYPGENDTQRAMAYLSTKYGEAAWAKLTWDEKFKAAVKFTHENKNKAA